MKGQQPAKEIDRLAKAYRAARTEFERRGVCIKAIDAGVIAVRRPVAVVDAIFGTSYAKKRRPPFHELETGTVEFHPLPPPPRNDIQMPSLAGILASVSTPPASCRPAGGLLLKQRAQIEEAAAGSIFKKRDQ